MTSTAQDARTDTWSPRSRVWQGDETAAVDVPVAEIAGRPDDDPATKASWWVPRTRATLADTARLFRLDAFAVDDVLSDRERPKLDSVGSTAVIVGALVTFDAKTGELHKDRVAVPATDRMLTVVADRAAAAPLIRRLPDAAGG